MAVRLSSLNSFILSANISEEYPNRESFASYETAGDDQLYIVAEISQPNYPMMFALGDNVTTFSISDFPNLYINGPLIAGSSYSTFVRFFSPLPPVSCSY